MKFKVSILTIFLACGLLVVSACAPNQPEKNTNTSPETTAVDWSMTSDCSVCHVDQKESQENSNCLASVHVSQGCVSCHSDESVMSQSHESVDASSKLPKKLSPKAKVTNDICMSCHNDLDKLAEATTDFTGLTDSVGTTVNPHVLPETHLGDYLQCNDCHVVHKENDMTEAAQESCLSCHHADVYECNTCHH